MIGTKLGIPVIRSSAPPEDLPGLRIGHFNDYAGRVITFPAGTSREDFERMKAEIQAALDWAELRGEQKALAFLLDWGIPPVRGVLGQPEWTQGQIDDIMAASEKRVKAALRRAKLAAEDNNDHQANLD